jgi:hypothetical protein
MCSVRAVYIKGICRHAQADCIHEMLVRIITEHGVSVVVHWCDQCRLLTCNTAQHPLRSAVFEGSVFSTGSGTWLLSRTTGCTDSCGGSAVTAGPCCELMLVVS